MLKIWIIKWKFNERNDKKKMKVNIDRDKFYDVEVDKLKILMKADTL